MNIYPELKNNYLNPLIITKKLVDIDPNFPPYELWVEYYNVKHINDIISFKTNKKKMGVILD